MPTVGALTERPPTRTHAVGAAILRDSCEFGRPPAAPASDHHQHRRGAHRAPADTHPRRRGGHWPPARGRNLPDLSLRASDRCHWRGNPFPLAFRLSPALRFMAGWHACRRPDFLIAQKVSKDAPGRGKIPNLSPLPGPLSPFKRPKGVVPLLDIPEIPPTLAGLFVP